MINKIFTSIICIILIIVSFTYGEEKEIGPKIETNVRIIDFSTVRTIEEKPGAFTRLYPVEIRNVGDKDLNISKIETDCECLKVNLSNNTIPPQNKVMMDIRIETAGISGKIEKTIKIHSNDPNNPQKIIIVRGEIRISPELLKERKEKEERLKQLQLKELPNPWELSESRIFFGFVKVGKKEIKKVTLMHRDKKEFKIKKIENKIKSIKVKVNTIEINKKYEIEVIWQPKKEDKDIFGDIIIKTDLEDQQVVVISVLGHVE